MTDKQWCFDNPEEAAELINKLTEERDALKAQLSGKADIANQLKDDLTDAFERELSLKAQVEQLRTVIDALVFGADRKFIDGEMTYMIPANHIISIGKAFGKEPAQCLAEVRAQASRDGFIAGCHCGASYNVHDWDNQAGEYAHKVRQQAKG